MNEQQALSQMIAPGTRRESKWRGGVIQILVTSNCDKACFNCTQLSQLQRLKSFMSPKHFEQAVLSLKGYFGVVGVFGGNPALSPHFADYCNILHRHVPFDQRGLWCNNPISVDTAVVMRATFNPAVSNLNVHTDPKAYEMFKIGWPEARPFGLHEDSRHSPPWVAMKDLDMLPANPGHDRHYNTKVPNTEENRYNLIANCDINKHWSAGIGVFRGQLRAWFCEIAMAQSIYHQWDMQERGPEGIMDYVYPDTGIDIVHENELLEMPGNIGKARWWQLPMISFREQVRKHCHECGVPLRGYGELAQSGEGSDATEQVSQTHSANFKPKRTGRRVEVVTDLVQLNTGRLQKTTDYMGNANK